MTPLQMSYEESYADAFPFDKMVPAMLNPEMIEDTAKMANEAIKDRVQVNLIMIDTNTLPLLSALHQMSSLRYIQKSTHLRVEIMH